jgi:hypothetical protein
VTQVLTGFGGTRNFAPCPADNYAVMSLRWTATSRILTAMFVVLLAACGQAPAPTRAATGVGAIGALREPISALVGDSPNFAQLANGDLMTVVSRDFGRGAKAGALVEAFWPSYATDQLWDARIGLSGADGRTTWLHDTRLLGQEVVPDTGLVVSRFVQGARAITVEDVIDPVHAVHLRRVRLRNNGSVPLPAIGIVHRVFWHLDQWPAGDRLTYDKASGALLQVDGGTAAALLADRMPDRWQCGLAGMPAGAGREAAASAEAGTWPMRTEAGPAVSGVDGAMRVTLPELAPAGEATVTWAMGFGNRAGQALDLARAVLGRGFEEARRADATVWGRWLGEARMPGDAPEGVRTAHRRALIAMLQCQTRGGAVIAAPTATSPPYRFVWPRDSAWIADAFLAAGLVEPARRAVSFLEQVQQSGGGWAVNYFPDGSRAFWDFGDDGNEDDQAGSYLWIVERAMQARPDDAWLAARWPHVVAAASFLVRRQEGGGLLKPCRDLWELETGGQWTYTQGAAWAGLTAAARLARYRGEMALSSGWEAAATRLGDAMRASLAPQGIMLRGLKGGRPDARLEAANLALGPVAFGFHDADDPVQVRTAAAIVQRLSAADGSIRRYEGDRYYDGQPWPVTTAWVALDRLARGERAPAEALEGIIIRQAAATGAWMLGEQFDPGRKLWLSAFPLTWSEAAAVRLFLALHPPAGLTER